MSGSGFSRWRRRPGRNILRLCGVLVVGAMAIVSSSLFMPAAAQSPDPGMQQCIDAKPVDVSPFDWVCQSRDGSSWKGVERGGGSGAGAGSGALGAFFAFALVWSLIPLVIAVTMAGSRGESIGMAVLLTLVLGWIGLAIVWFGQKKSQAAVEGLAGGSTAPPRPPPPQAAPVADDPEERLRRLERLHQDRLVGDEEYRQQRERILGSI